MENNYDWYWNEFNQIGNDYESDSEIAAYDQRMRNARDIEGDVAIIQDMIQPNPSKDILEIGTGSGLFARTIAKSCHHVTAIDISPAMLHYAENCAHSEGTENITFERAGFLSHRAPEAAYDAVVTGLAFHHLPDLWKAIALRNIVHWLRPGGQFILLDLVFDWKDEAPEDYFSHIVETAAEDRTNFTRHISQEYITFDWILKGLMERAGLEIEQVHSDNYFRKIYSTRLK